MSEKSESGEGGAARRVATIERHIQTLLTALVIAVGGWLASEVADSGEQIARLDEQMRNVKEKLDMLTVSQHSAETARREMAIIDERVRQLSLRVDSLERESPARASEGSR